jgi:hypothetical protein
LLENICYKAAAANSCRDPLVAATAAEAAADRGSKQEQERIPLAAAVAAAVAVAAAGLGEDRSPQEQGCRT